MTQVPFNWRPPPISNMHMDQILKPLTFCKMLQRIPTLNKINASILLKKIGKVYTPYYIY